LVTQHGDEVRLTGHDGKFFYEIDCPLCGARHEQLLRKGTRDPEFLAEFGTEIRMVAFDMLVHHLTAEHDQAADHQAAHEQHNVSDRQETRP
jgi:hypothetical protein